MDISGTRFVQTSYSQYIKVLVESGSLFCREIKERCSMGKSIATTLCCHSGVFLNQFLYSYQFPLLQRYLSCGNGLDHICTSSPFSASLTSSGETPVASTSFYCDFLWLFLWHINPGFTEYLHGEHTLVIKNLHCHKNECVLIFFPLWAHLADL